MAIEKIDVVIPAAGAGRRMGASVPKQYLRIADREILARTADVFLSLPFAGRIIIALAPDDTLFDTLDISHSPRVVRAAGGAERSDSVLAGLRASETEFTLVHDAARPMVRPADIGRLVSLALDDDGGLLAFQTVRDTIKLADHQGDGTARSVRTEPRELLWHALTPQLFRTELLIKALESAASRGLPVTDESSAMELAGYRPRLVSSDPGNIKITEPGDLAAAEEFFRRQPSRG